MEKYYTTREFAKISNKREANIRLLCQRGQIPQAFKISGPANGVWLIPKGAIITVSKGGAK